MVADPPAGNTTKTNTAPLIAGTPATSVAAGATYSFTPTSGDSDGDRLLFGVDSKPAWATFDTATGRLSGTPAASDARTYRGIVVWVTDGTTATALPAFDLAVTGPRAVNRAPQISGAPPVAVIAGSSYVFTPTASDPDNVALAFTISNRPPWASFDPAIGRLEGTPQVTDAGTFSGIVIFATDGQATASLAPFDVVVTVPALNRPPVISGAAPGSVAAGNPYVFVPTADDPDGDPLRFAVQQLPTWAAFDTQTGRLSGTPPPGTAQTFTDVVISVTDGALSAVLPAFAIAVTGPTPNRAPVITGSPSTTVVAGAAYAFQPVAVDADDDPLTYTASNPPGWAHFDERTGLLAGTPGAGDVGTQDRIVISVTDGKATVALPEFAIAVASANRPPVISGVPPSIVSAGEGYLFQPTATDPDLDALTYRIANVPPWATFDTATGRLQGTPAVTDAGSFPGIVVSVSDGPDTGALPAFTIRVNRPPAISGTAPPTGGVGASYTFTPAASDADGDALSFSVGNPPIWATFDARTGTLQGMPVAGTSPNVTIAVSDGYATRALPPFSITIPVPNAPPSISGAPATTVVAGASYSFTPTASDPNAGTTLTYDIANRPAWAAFSATTGTLQGAPTAAHIGTTTGIVISVSDGNATASLAAFSIAVTNTAPVISGTPGTSVPAGAPYSFTPTASDANPGTTLTFSINQTPPWATFNSATGQLQGTPATTHTGTYSNLVISASDGELSASLAAFSITVTNSPPAISGTPPTSVVAGAPYSFTPTASDPNAGTTLTFSINTTPAWATFSRTTGSLQGTTTAAHIGTTNGIVISVSDGNATASLAAFSIAITNTAPVISGAPGTTVAVGASYSFAPTASDANPGTALTFGINQTPPWATFTSATGRLQGTPSTGDTGTFSNIVISVSDGRASTPLAAFSITVTNATPVISGVAPATATVGNPYTFTPTASDANAGTTLTFSLNTTPPWATFNPATGQLQGTPAAVHVGTYSSLVIAVSDGVAQASLPAFTITVQAVATGSALLTWIPPTQNTDGTPLTNLAGYKFYWGPALGNYPSSHTEMNPGLTSFVVEDLAPGTYFFVVTALNSSLVESQFSNATTKTVLP